MNDPTTPPPETAEPAPADPAAACGAVLRAAREAAGLSIDRVAQQLKLHPRQVQALEDGQHELLPGRTFARGFLRNYARAFQIDPDQLLAMLPDDRAPQAIGPTGPGMAEIRFESAPRRSWTRWAIPLALVTLVALAAIYEFMRPGADSPRRGTGTTSSSPTAAAPSTDAPAASGPITSGAPAGTPLPNPLTKPPADGARAPEPSSGAAPAPAMAPGVGAAGVVSTAIPPAAPGEPTLVIVYEGRSWTQVRDANGKLLLSLTGSPGMTQSVTGTPPLDVIIGSVADVSMRFRGAPVDLEPYRRANVARIRLD